MLCLEQDLEAAGYSAAALPANWRIAPLKRLANVNPGPPIVSDEVEASFVPMEDVGDDGQLHLTQARVIGEIVGTYTPFLDGDILIAKITPCFENGKIARAFGLSNGVGFGTTELHVLRPNSGIEPAFLFYVTRSSIFRDLGTSRMTGAAGQKRVPSDFVAEFPVFLPPIDEQQAIAAFLDRETARIGGLIAKTRRLIELLREKRQAVISYAVTKGLNRNAPMKDSGIEWLDEIPAHWEVKQLRYLIRPGTSITYGIVQAGPHVDDGVPYIRTSDMAGDFLPEEGYLRTSPEIDAMYSRSKVRAGDLVVAIRATVGKTLPVPNYLDGANLTQGTAKICLRDRISRDFILFVLNSANSSSGFTSMAKGATFKEITLEMLRKFPVPLPPFEEQSTLAAVLSSRLAPVQTAIDIAEAAIAKLEEHRAALIAAAVTGKIDVRARPPEAAEAAD
jgi:type I restriction enzyme S subunit